MDVDEAIKWALLSVSSSTRPVPLEKLDHPFSRHLETKLVAEQLLSQLELLRARERFERPQALKGAAKRVPHQERLH